MLTSSPVFRVSEHLGELQQRVGNIVKNHDETSDSEEVTRPGEHHQQDGGIVMDHHLKEVLSLHIEELANGQ